MDNTFFAAQFDPHIYSIDLHSAGSVYDALDILERELFFCYKRGDRYVRIVHGIGTGTLAAAVIDAVEKNPLVIDFQKEDHGGATLLAL